MRDLAKIPALLPRVVIDTNWVLDLWVFDDPGASALRHALQSGEVCWLATPSMRDELARVLTYPRVAKYYATVQRDAQQILAQFDAMAHLVHEVKTSAIRCRDADDQYFIDLAVTWGTCLLSKDWHLLELARKLALLGVRVQRQWGDLESVF